MPLSPTFRDEKIPGVDLGQTGLIKSNTHWFDRVLSVDTSAIPYRCDRQAHDFSLITYPYKYLWALKAFVVGESIPDQIAFLLQFYGFNCDVVVCDLFRLGATVLPNPLRDKDYREIRVVFPRSEVSDLRIVEERSLRACEIVSSNYNYKVIYADQLTCPIFYSINSQDIDIEYSLDGVGFANKDVWELLLQVLDLPLRDRLQFVLSELGFDCEIFTCPPLQLGQSTIPHRLFSHNYPYVFLKFADSVDLSAVRDRVLSICETVAYWYRYVIGYDDIRLGESIAPARFGDPADLENLDYPNRHIWQLKATAVFLFDALSDQIDYVLGQLGYSGYTIIRCAGFTLNESTLPGLLLSPRTYPYVYILFDQSVDVAGIDEGIRAACEIVAGYKSYVIGYSQTLLGKSTLPAILHDTDPGITNACPSL